MNIIGLYFMLMGATSMGLGFFSLFYSSSAHSRSGIKISSQKYKGSIYGAQWFVFVMFGVVMQMLGFIIAVMVD